MADGAPEHVTPAGVMSEHAAIMPSSISGEYAIMGENTLLMDNLDFFTATICLLCLYYACDLKYNEAGLKTMVFLQEGLAQIRYGQKIPTPVYKLLMEMKR